MSQKQRQWEHIQEEEDKGRNASLPLNRQLEVDAETKIKLLGSMLPQKMKFDG